MRDIIHLLPDAIANQIAAGEVVQRPASVVKELLENAVDAGATRIEILIKDAGKTLIQVSDNGSGMSATDARMAFERHATSKIQNQDDLFGIRTLGFRGEALASIAAVAQVKLMTRQQGQEIGTELEIEASKVKKQQPAACPPGSTFQVKNLFYNVPARRNFLKTNARETRHILNEFIRVALPHPEIYLSLHHNETMVYDLPPQTLEQRIIELFGKDLEGNLVETEEATGYARLSGFIGGPEVYRKTRGEQFFFVNQRFIKSNYLNHAISEAYKEFIPKDTHPFYVIFIGIDPIHVDINIHPTKTEVKFDDERTLYVLLQGMIRRGLAMRHQVPEIDFGESDITRAIYQSPSVPSQNLNPTPTPSKSSSGGGSSPQVPKQNPVPKREQWEPLYQAPPAKTPTPKPQLIQQQQEEEARFLVQYQNRYILTQRGQKLLILDQHLAHQRILYERFLHVREAEKIPCQQLLFPQTIEFSTSDYQALRQADDVLVHLGFEIKEFGRNTLIIYGTPSGITTHKVKDIFAQILADIKQLDGTDIQKRLFEEVARAVAIKCAVTSSQKLSTLEMKNMVEELFKCQNPGFSPTGRPTFKEISGVELEEYFR
ncbi:MAG: DNA mismatch repair endonuclease MutL [Bacteroidota bacterium]